MIHDSNGHLFKFDLASKRQTLVFSFNAGQMRGVSTASADNACATIGEDGVVRLWDFVAQKEFYSRKFLGAGTCVDWLTLGFNHNMRVVAAGFEDGCVRVVHFSKEKIVLTTAYKVHNNRVQTLKFSPDGETCVILAQNGDFFFFKISLKDRRAVFEPYAYYPSKMAINSLCWNRNSSHLLMSTQLGTVVELEVPRIEDCDFSETFLVKAPEMKSFTIMMMMSQKPKKDMSNKMAFLLDEKVEEVEVEWDAAPITSAVYLDEEEGTFICSVEGLFAGKLYTCKFGEERPLAGVDCSKSRKLMMEISEDRKYLQVGSENGEVSLHPLEMLEISMTCKMHDQDDGVVNGICLNLQKTALLSTSCDGTLNVKAMDYSFLERVLKIRKDMKMEKEKLKADRGSESSEGDYSVDGEAANGEGEEEQELPSGEQGAAGAQDEGEEEEDWDSSSEEEIDTIVWPEVSIPPLETGIDDRFFVDEPEDLEDVDDILDAGIYSIQEEKLKAEEDKRRELAEIHKQKMRENIENLRQEFTTLRKQNVTLEEFFRLEESSFTIDMEYHQMLVDRVEDMRSEAVKDMAWSIERSILRTKKLRDFFLKELEVDRFSVCGFRRTIVVTTFKVKSRSEYFQRWQKENAELTQDQEREQMIEDEQMEETVVRALEEDTENDIWGGKNVKNMSKDLYLQKKKELLRTQFAKESKEKFTIERMKVEKAKRMVKRKDLAAKKPKQTDLEDDRNLEIKKANENMGDYKLKCDPYFEVQFDQQMTVSKQRRVITMVEEFIYTVRMDFNKSIIEMRSQRAQIFEWIRETNTRIRVINSELGVEEDLFEPVYNEDIEFPERIYIVKDEEVKAFAKERKEQEKRAKKGRFAQEEAEVQVEGVVGGDTNPNDTTVLNVTVNTTGGAVQEGQKGPASQARQELNYRVRDNVRDRMTEALEEERMISKLRLETEKSILLDKIEHEIRSFDCELEILSTTKTQLEYEIKLAAMKVITFFQELIVLEAHEEKDKIFLKELAEQKEQLKQKNSDRSTLLLQSKEQNEQLRNKLNNMRDAEHKYHQKIDKDKAEADNIYAAYKEYKKTSDERGQDDDRQSTDAEMNEADDVSSRPLSRGSSRARPSN